MPGKNDCFLAGPKNPFWACACGSANNYASRIKCRCGKDAPHRILHAAREAAKRANTAPIAKVPAGGSQNSREIAELRREVEALRAYKKAFVVVEEEGEEEEVANEMDIQKLQSALSAVTAAHGQNSPQATEMAKDLARVREERQKAKPVSLQLRAAERRCTQKRKGLETAKLNATVAAEAVRAAQRALVEADEKVASCVYALQEEETNRQALCQRSAENIDAPVRDTGVPASLNELAAEMEGDNEALHAVELIRAKLAQKHRDKEVPVPAEEDHELMVVDSDILQLERQSAAAKRLADDAEEKVHQFKRNRTGIVNMRESPC